MRIIAGKAGRVSIRVPKAVTRPTSDFVRQAVFSRLGERVVGARVLDLFAGSGALGLEALSRGARDCCFVDDNRLAESTILANLAKSRLEGGRVLRADVHAWLRREHGRFDLIFADPPYFRTPFDRDHLGELLGRDRLGERLEPEGILVVEQSADEPERTGSGLCLLDRRDYGGTSILLYAGGADS